MSLPRLCSLVICKPPLHRGPTLTHRALSKRLRSCLRRGSIVRTYATYHETSPSALLSQTLDQKRQGVNGPGGQNVGPFQLGLLPPAGGSQAKQKKWSELSTGGKVVRTTARTTNLAVILLGAGLVTVLTYALTSELFSKNSPTVLYGQACEKIKRSPRVARYLHAPLSFHNNPPSVVRPRHRNHNVSSRIAVDSSGREHMLLNFFVASSPSTSAHTLDAEDDNLFDQAVSWTQSKWDDATSTSMDDIKARWKSALDSMKANVRFLSGEPVAHGPVAPQGTARPQDNAQEVEEPGIAKRWLGGLFGALKVGKGVNGSEHGTGADNTLYLEGEVHADLVRNDEGYFVFRYLLIDIPDSRGRNPTRIFVERASDVRETEPVMRWARS